MKYLVDLDLNKNELQNAALQNLATAPSNPVAGQMYYDTAANKAYVWNGTSWVPWEANTVTGVKGNSESSYRTGNVNITAANVGAAASSHAHGNITSGGDITAAAPEIASGDQIIINDNSASKITNGPSFDGSTTTTALTPKGTWETFAKLASPAFTGTPTAPTANQGTDTTQIATTAFINNKIWYGVCSSTSNAKEVTCGGYVLRTGSWIAVKFSSTNTATVNLTLNVNDTGAKPIKYRGTNLPKAGILSENGVCMFVYDGTNYELVGSVDTTYSGGTQALLEEGTSTTNYLWQPKIIHDYISGVVSAVDAMRFKGTLGTGGTVTTLPTTGVKVGDTYRVITAGTYASIVCEVGDLVIATATTPTWTVAQNNIDGAVTASTTTTSGYLAKFTGDKIVANGPQLGSSTSTYLRNDGGWATPTNTKNTAGSTDSSSKLFLIGATSQAANPQTYSHDTAYVGTDGCLYSGGEKVLTAHHVKSEVLTLTAGQTSVNALTTGIIYSYEAVIDGTGEIVMIDFQKVTSGYTFSIASAITSDITINFLWV